MHTIIYIIVCLLTMRPLNHRKSELKRGLQSFLGIYIDKHLRGHVNKKKFQKSKKTLEGGGWVKCPIGYKKKLENIFLCIISFGFGEHSNVYSVINAP